MSAIDSGLEFRRISKRRRKCLNCSDGKLKHHYIGIGKLCIDCADMEDMFNRYDTFNITSATQAERNPAM